MSLRGLPGIFQVTNYTHILRNIPGIDARPAKLLPHFPAWSKFRGSLDHGRESLHWARLPPAHATDFHLCDFRSHYHTNELLFRSAESLCLIECAFYPRCSCSIYQHFSELLGNGEERKYWLRDAEGTVIIILSVTENNSECLNNLKSFILERWAYF